MLTADQLIALNLKCTNYWCYSSNLRPSNQIFFVPKYANVCKNMIILIWTTKMKLMKLTVRTVRIMKFWRLKPTSMEDGGHSHSLGPVTPVFELLHCSVFGHKNIIRHVLVCLDQVKVNVADRRQKKMCQTWGNCISLDNKIFFF